MSLPGLRLRAREDTPTRAALDAVLACPQVIFTSPEAVRCAARLRALHPRTSRRVFALGAGTRAALRRAGIVEVRVPNAANSESLLAMDDFAAIASARIGLVTAPGGRGTIATRLRARGASLAIAEVYAREPARLRAAQTQRLLDLRGRGAVCVTSAEALANVLAALVEPARRKLLSCVAIVSSARLHGIAVDAGFAVVVRAAGPTPGELLHALSEHAAARGFR